MSIANKFRKLVEKDDDILIKLRELGNLGKQLDNTEITTFVNFYNGLLQNAPYLIERKNWDEKIFLEKRREVDNRQKEIMDKIIQFKEDHFCDYINK